MERNGNSDDGKLGRTETTITQKKKKGQGKGRNCYGAKKGFSYEQIRLLETMFETETKPEPRKKVELARELGLQPRQVAIWFQNRRARWKSKQLEQEYRVLKCNYDKLLVDFELLKKEGQSLRSEFQGLSCMLGIPGDGDDDDSGSGHEAKFIGGRECFNGKWMFCSQTQDGTPCKIENSVEDGYELLNMAGDEYDGRSTAGVPEKWCNFGFGDLSDYSCSNNNNNNNYTQWWNFCT